MDNTISNINSEPTRYPESRAKPRIIPTSMRLDPKVILDIGKTTKVSEDDAMNMVYERAMAKLQGVVSDAKAELDIPEGAELDTSPEATANRIADFALGFYDKWRANNASVAEEDAKATFTEFIGVPIKQGVDEARKILQALNALSPGISDNVDKIVGLVEQRLADFAASY